MIIPLKVNRLRLEKFRSYAHLDLVAEASTIVLIGPNGAGKTNILEAISLLTPGRGMRRATLADLSQRRTSTPQSNTDPSSNLDPIETTTTATATDWAIHAQIDGLLGAAAIGTGVQNGKRVVRLDGETASGPGALAHHMSALWLTPTMDRLFVEGAAGRRRFFDRLVFGLQPEHGPHATAYEKAMRDRSQLLKERTNNTDWLATLETRMAEHGTAMARARLETVRRLQAAIDQTEDSLFPKADLIAQGTLEDSLANQASEQDVREDFLNRLRLNRARDAETGGAIIGPHKSDLHVRHAGHGQPAQHCSTGEQKALLVTIVLANAREQMHRRQAAPILLLDEVAAHMDADRRAALYHHLSHMGGQVWLTGTDHAFFHTLEGIAQFHNVSESAIVP